MNKKLSLLLAVFFITCGVEARILRTNNTPGSSAEFSSLSSAYTAAAEGDTIYLEGSTTAYLDYGASFTINKQLTILGPGYWLVDNGITHYGTSAAFLGNSTKLIIAKEGVVIRGLYLRNILIKTSNVVINRCNIESISFEDTAHDIVIHQNYITYDIGGPGNAFNISITNNIINGSYGITRLYDSYIAYNHIKVYEISGDLVKSTTFKNNIIHVTTYSGYTPDSSCSYDDSNYKKDWALQCLGGDTSFKTDKDYQLLANSP
ncbi:hypothetical protein LJC21_01790, partial [Bacteroides sp. OttesenSCG-928-E20]|nr:hypothetical protein [Bacteroides sp. OttesenSCG-928-E20]